jgi:hypothetical protein
LKLFFTARKRKKGDISDVRLPVLILLMSMDNKYKRQPKHVYHALALLPILSLEYKFTVCKTRLNTKLYLEFQGKSLIPPKIQSKKVDSVEAAIEQKAHS